MPLNAPIAMEGIMFVAMKEERERTPLRIILQNFINHVENLETYRSENSYDKEFQDLKIFSESLKSSGDYSCKEGEKEFNRKKNRYKDILPFDYTRVTLSEYVGVPGSDYINANYIKGASGSPAYIASQGPLPHTVNDFWRMVVECEVQVIVMACNEEESGKHKCENYWVDKEGEEKKFGMVAIRLLKASTICPDFLVRTMQLKYVNAHSIPEERVVCQFHYGAWPDHGVPGLVRPLLEMVRLVRDTQASETLPVLVHCSAGCGRTGTICAIDYVWGLLRAGKLRLDFSLFKLVRDMRKQRIAMVQTKDQYILVHQAVRELFQDQLRMIHSHPYENIDVRGHPLLPAHSSKTTILHPRRTALASDEKQDGKEKETSVVGSNALHHQASVLKSVETVDAPPLPHKKRIHTVSSKQEKEVENLTQKQLSIASASVNTKIQSSFDGETLDKRDDKVVVVLEKNLKIMNPESLAKGSEKPSIEPLSRNVDLMNYLSPHSLCLEETVKASPNNLLPSSVCNIHHSITANQTEDTSNLQKPCIAKLKALFESNSYVKDGRTNVLRAVEIKQRLPQQVTRSHSLGAVRKPHKFTQFNAASPEIGFQPQQSSDLNETGRYKSASNIHVDVYSPKVSDGDETVNTNLCDLEHLKTPCASRSTSISHNKCESSNILQPHISSSYVQMAGGKVPGLSCLPEKPLSATHMFSASGVMHEDSRPALPIKRSKSLKVQSATDHFKLTLVKRSHGLTQEVSSSEGESNFPHSNLLECNPEISSHSRTSKECESLSRGRVGCSSTPKNIKCKCKVPPDSVRLNTASNTLFQISDLQESASRPIFTDVKSEIGPVHEGSSVIHKISNDSEYLVKFPEKKKVNEYFPKLNRDICRAQSLHVKREKTTPHVSTTFSQESEYVNVKTVDKGNNWRHTNEPLNVRVLSADDICKCVAQNQSNIPLDACNIVEDCSNYLLSEEFTAPTFNESQRIAAANARHKVDTVAGGLGIRERRNSFRCAVGQGVDEKSIRAETSDRESKWISRNTELKSVPYAEAVSMKREFERKITNSPKRPEIINMQKKPKEWCKGVEPNVVSKNSPLLLNSTNSNDCKYVTSVKLSEKPDVNNVQKPSRTMEVLTVSSGVAQKNVGQNGKMQSDSSSFQTSPNVWKHSLCTGIKNSNYIPSKHNSKSPAEDLLPNSPKGNMHSEVHYHWPAHQVNVLPQKKGNSSVHHAESLGSQSNLNSVVPLEVDVDQVGASMRNNLQGKYEGAKTPVSPDNSTQANSAASTHFTRALEVFHQTAASIRTKFSRPSAGSGTNPTRTSESSTKVGMPSQNQLSLFRPQQNGNPKRDVRDIVDQPKVLRKQQHYL